MLGAVIGDIVGSVYERNNIKTKDFPFFSPQSTFTDDTVCIMGVADTLLNHKEYAPTMRQWGQKYLPITGFSKKFAEWIQTPDAPPYGAKSNGCVMKIPPVAFLIHDTEQALKIADDITNQTHNHPDSIHAVHAFIETIHACRKGQSPDKIKAYLEKTFGYDMHRTVDTIRSTYDKFYISCTKSVPESIICALDATSFEDAIRNAVSLGGDSDTLACMAGAIAETRFGIPYSYREIAMQKLPAEMQYIMHQMYPNTALTRQPLFCQTVLNHKNHQR